MSKTAKANKILRMNFSKDFLISPSSFNSDSKQLRCQRKTYISNPFYKLLQSFGCTDPAKFPQVQRWPRPINQCR
jgi:hypothetical protein